VVDAPLPLAGREMRSGVSAGVDPARPPAAPVVPRDPPETMGFLGGMLLNLLTLGVEESRWRGVEMDVPAG